MRVSIPLQGLVVSGQNLKKGGDEMRKKVSIPLQGLVVSGPTGCLDRETGSGIVSIPLQGLVVSGRGYSPEVRVSDNITFQSLSRD